MLETLVVACRPRCRVVAVQQGDGDTPLVLSQLPADVVGVRSCRGGASRLLLLPLIGCRAVIVGQEELVLVLVPWWLGWQGRWRFSVPRQQGGP